VRLRIRHTTRFRYAKPARASFNQVRLTPRHDETQNLLSFSLLVSPQARLTRHHDHFGTLVHTFNIHPAHHELVIVGESEVVSGPRRQPTGTEEGTEEGTVAGGIDALAEPAFVDAYAEWLHPSPYTSDAEALPAFSAQARAAGEAYGQPGSVRDLVEGVCRHVRGYFTYAPGSTYVHTTVAEALERRRGVCQDYVHVAVGTLRALGVPARYVSGYFYNRRGEPHPDVPVEVQSHAWLEAFVPGFGWWEYDPTNGCPADERHVVVAVGRDYGDVAPVSGVLQGGGGQRLQVTVEMVVPSTPPPLLSGGIRLQSQGQGSRFPGRPAASAARRLAEQAQQQQ